MKIAAILLVSAVLLLFANIIIGILLAFHNRKCKYCGKRMKHVRTKCDSEGHAEEYIFHCPHCGAWEQVTPIEMIREGHGERN